MDNLTPITREEMLMNDEPLTPITREEKILAGEDLTPVTRREYFLKKYRHAGGDVMVEGLEVTANGTYTAPEGKAYSPVEVAVPLPENAYLLKTASGSLVSFSDGADLPIPSFVCNIDAVQDLHGYDGPWVGGAGKNKFNASALSPLATDGITATVSNGEITFNGTATNNAYFNVYGLGLINSSGFALSFNNFDTNSGVHIVCRTSGGTYFTDRNANRVNQTSTTSTTDLNAIIIYVESGTQLTNFKIKPQVEFGQTPTPWTPYSNICPISGHNGVDVWVKGKNLFNASALTPLSTDGITVTVNDGTITLNGTATANAYFNVYNTGYQTGTYSWSFNNSAVNEGVRLSLRDSVGSYWKDMGCNAVNKTAKVTGEPDDLILFVTKGTVLSNFTIKPQLELGETATTYEPYNPNSQTIQVSWQTEAGEVFGGYVDLVSGVLVADRLYFEISNFGSWEYQEYNNFKALYKHLSVLGYPPIKNTSDRKFISDKFKYSYEGAYQPFGVFSIYSNGIIYFWNNDNTYANKNEMITAMNSIKPSVCYELATPITYQLTPTQIKSLLGNNNAWCDTGDVNIDYFAKEVTG